MQTLFDLDAAPLSKEEVAAVLRAAREFAHVWKKRALYSTAAFFLSCASVVPFLYGHSLHAYWNSFGKYLVLLSMALLIPFGICVSIAINSWFYLRSLRKTEL
jgi:hypothetical protein